MLQNKKGKKIRFNLLPKKMFSGSLRSNNTAPDIITKTGTPNLSIESNKLANCQEAKLILLNLRTNGAVTCNKITAKVAMFLKLLM